MTLRETAREWGRLGVLVALVAVMFGIAVAAALAPGVLVFYLVEAAFYNLGWVP